VTSDYSVPVVIGIAIFAAQLTFVAKWTFVAFKHTAR
jgi:hypothetical protein